VSCATTISVSGVTLADALVVAVVVLVLPASATECREIWVPLTVPVTLIMQGSAPPFRFRV
jgi:hypothetical protein